MKVHTPPELVSCLANVITNAAAVIPFSVVSTDSPPDSCGFVSVLFDLDGLAVRMDRDRCEIDFFVQQSSGEWKILSWYWERFASTGISAPSFRTKELFDPGYTEEEAIREGATALVAMRASIAELTE